MPVYSSRLNLPSPSASDAANVPADMASLTAALDNGAQWVVTSGATPATTIIGTLWSRTDNSNIYILTNAGWSPIGIAGSVGTSAPTSPYEGQTWLDTSVSGASVLKRYNTTAGGWTVTYANVTTAATTPSNPLTGQLKYETDSKFVKVYTDSVNGWVLPNASVPYVMISQTNTLTKGTALNSGNLPLGTDGVMFLLAANVSSTASSDGYFVADTGTSQGWVRVTQAGIYRFDFGCGVNAISANWGNSGTVTDSNISSFRAVLLKQTNGTGNWTTVNTGSTEFPQKGTTSGVHSIGSSKVALAANDRLAVGYRLSNNGTGTLDFSYTVAQGPDTYIHGEWVGP